MPQQYVILARDNGATDSLAPIGNRDSILQVLREFNTGPDHEGGDILYGPGIQIELPPGADPIPQMLMTITEEEIAWLAIMRLTRTLNWKLLDPVTGRELNG